VLRETVTAVAASDPTAGQVGALERAGLPVQPPVACVAQPTVQPMVRPMVQPPAQPPAQPMVQVGALAAALTDRAFGFLILLFALLALAPLPGVASLMGVPLVVLGAQLAAGYAKPWLPAAIARRAIARDMLLRGLEHAALLLERFEIVCRPRRPLLIAGPAERLIGLAVALFGAVIILPFPMSNFGPALGTAVMALGIIEHDGVMVATGFGIAIVGVIAMLSIIGAVGTLALWSLM